MIINYEKLKFAITHQIIELVSYIQFSSSVVILRAKSGLFFRFANLLMRSSLHVRVISQMCRCIFSAHRPALIKDMKLTREKVPHHFCLWKSHWNAIEKFIAFESDFIARQVEHQTRFILFHATSEWAAFLFNFNRTAVFR